MWSVSTADELRSHIFSEYPNLVFSRLVLPERVPHKASSGDNTMNVCKCCCGAQEHCSKLSDKATTGDNDAVDSTLAAELSTTQDSLSNQLQRRTDEIAGALEQEAEELCTEGDRGRKVGLEELPRDYHVSKQCVFWWKVKLRSSQDLNLGPFVHRHSPIFRLDISYAW